MAFDIIAVAALAVSVVAIFIAWSQARSTRSQAAGTWQQAAATQHANDFSRATAYAGTILSFVTHFLGLLAEGDPREVLTSPESGGRWADRFWGLYTIEFWYFHHRLLPVDMFTYWMGYLSELYAEDKAMYLSHKSFLASYEHTYPAMAEFFEQLKNLAENNANPAERNRRVQTYVKDWIGQHPADIELDQEGRVVPPARLP